MNANKCVYHIVTNSKMMLGQRIVFDNTCHNLYMVTFLLRSGITLKEKHVLIF